MERAFKTRTFSRWMRKTGLTDDALCAAVEEMIQGLVDANLGGYLVKKRVALPGKGKRGGARTIVATKMEQQWFFIFGFNKNERSNIHNDELKALQEMARDLLDLSDIQLNAALAAGEVFEVCNERSEAE